MFVNSTSPCKTPVRLYPLSDVHWPEHEHDSLVDWVNMVKKDKKAVVTLGGDMFDFCRTTARKHVKSYNEDSNSFSPIDRFHLSEIEEFAKFLKPIASKVVGACSGNHYHQFPDGQISDQKLALLLNEDSWMGAGGYIVIPLNGQYELKILLHHDAGRGGITPGADFNAFVRAASNAQADIICLGHTHRLMNVPGSTQINIENDKVGAHQTIFVRSGSYLKRYHEQVKSDKKAPFLPDYGELKMFAPSTFGHAIVEVSLQKGKPCYDLRTKVR